MTVEIKKTCVNKNIVLHLSGNFRPSCCLPVGFEFLGSLFLRNALAFWDQEKGTKARNICCELSLQERGLKEEKHLGCGLTIEGGTVGRLKRPASANHTTAVRYCGLLDPGSADLGERGTARPPSQTTTEGMKTNFSE